MNNLAPLPLGYELDGRFESVRQGHVINSCSAWTWRSRIEVEIAEGDALQMSELSVLGFVREGASISMHETGSLQRLTGVTFLRTEQSLARWLRLHWKSSWSRAMNLRGRAASR